MKAAFRDESDLRAASIGRNMKGLILSLEVSRSGCETPRPGVESWMKSEDFLDDHICSRSCVHVQVKALDFPLNLSTLRHPHVS